MGEGTSESFGGLRGVRSNATNNVEGLSGGQVLFTDRQGEGLRDFMSLLLRLSIVLLFGDINVCS